MQRHVTTSTIKEKERTLNGCKVYEDQKTHHTNNNNVNHVQSNNGLCISIIQRNGRDVKGGIDDRD